jgi:hypothetical protein
MKTRKTQSTAAFCVFSSMAKQTHRGLIMYFDMALSETLRAAEEQHGRTINYTKLGRWMGLSRQAARKRIQRLAENGHVILLPAFGTPYSVRSVKKSRIFVCRGHEEGSLVERIVWIERLLNPESRFFHFTSCYGPAVDLIVERGHYRFGIVTCRKILFGRRHMRALRSFLRSEILHRGFVLGPERRGYFAGRGMIALPPDHFMSAYMSWTAGRACTRKLLNLVRSVNRER